MENYNEIICTLYETYSIEDIVEFTKLAQSEVVEILRQQGVLDITEQIEEEYETAKELYLGGEALSSIANILSYMNKSQLRDRLLKDGVLRASKSKTYLKKEEYAQIREYAIIYSRAKEGKSLFAIANELGLDYHRLVYACKKLEKK